MNEFEATQMIKEEFPAAKVVIVSAYDDPLFVSNV